MNDAKKKTQLLATEIGRSVPLGGSKGESALPAEECRAQRWRLQRSPRSLCFSELD